MKKKVSSLFIVIGILSIILAFSAYGLDTGYTESNVSYGGDAYTGIQNAAAQTANNVHYLAEAVSFSAGSILLIAGLTLVIYGVNTFADINGITYDAEPETSETESTPNPTVNAAQDTTTERIVWEPVDEANALAVGETNIKCTNCHRVQFKGNKVCNQCGAKLTEIETQE